MIDTCAHLAIGTDTEAIPTTEGIVRPSRVHRELFAENYPKMQRVKAKYDSDMISNEWFVVHPVAA